MMKRQPSEQKLTKLTDKPQSAIAPAAEKHPLKFLKIQQHQDDFLEWLMASDNSRLHFVR